MNLAECRLRRVNEGDLERVRQWRNQDHIRTKMYSSDRVEPDEQRAWFETIKTRRPWPAYVYEESGRPLGYVGISQVEDRDRRCHWGYYIGEPDPPKGSGTRMGICALDLIFGELGFHRLIAETFLDNEASRRFLERLGFTHEGTLREHHRRPEGWIDVALYAIVESDWPDRRHHLTNSV